MDNPEELAKQGTQDEETLSKNTTKYVLDTTMRTQTQITQTRHEPTHKQLEANTSQTSFQEEIATDIKKVKTHNMTTCIRSGHVYFQLDRDGKKSTGFFLILNNLMFGQYLPICSKVIARKRKSDENLF